MSNDIAGGLKNLLPGPLDSLRGPYSSVAAACAAIPNITVDSKNYREGKIVDIGVISTGFTPYAWSGGYDDGNLLKQIDQQNKGNFNSIILANSGVPLVQRKLGDTVGIKENGSVVEYWWKNGVTDTDLVMKIALDRFIKAVLNGSFSLYDDNGNYGGGVLPDGTLDFYKISSSLRAAIDAALAYGLKKTVGGTFQYLDPNGIPAFGILPDGKIMLYKFESGTEKYISDFVKKSLDLTSLIPVVKSVPDLTEYSDVNHIIVYGQSLSVGQTEEVITTTNLYPNLICFDGIVRTSPYELSNTGEIYPIDRRLSFAPLVEKVNTGDISGKLRETPASGTAEMMAKEINKFSNVQFPILPMQILVSAPGQGAMAMANLSIGTEPFNRMLADVQKGYDLAQSLGKTYEVTAITLTQVENDYLAGTTPLVYKNTVRKFYYDADSAIRAISKQARKVILIINQNSTSKGGQRDYPDLAMAQLELCLETDGIYMAATTQDLVYQDGFHPNAVSIKFMGGYDGYVINQVRSFGVDWKPIHVISTLIQGNILKINFHVPKAPLRWGTPNGVNLPNKGFKVLSASGSDITGAVSLGGNGTSVNVLCSSSPVGGFIEYAANVTPVLNSILNLGCLQDSQGDTITTTIKGVVKPMNNGCPIFKYSI